MRGQQLLPTLTAEEIAEIEEEINHLPDRKSAAIDALMIVQKHRGWVSDESLGAISRLLAMSVEELDGVATFYNLVFRQPVGRHVVMVCDSVSCYVMGADDLAKEVQSQLGVRFGETTPDKRFTLLPIVCLGACDKAPAMMIDEDLIENVSSDRLQSIFGAYA
ncbi:MAG: NADH-quinone oxidoreductase subunit NuoE [Pseudomonadales bacterium]|nr:NADH-quinone oxidoreductase subunit NuoE [Pseudomonadales bacterium]